MISRRTVTVYATSVLLLFVLVAFARAADPVSPVLANYADILKANPMPPGEKSQAIKVAGDDSTTVFLARFAAGAAAKPHFHKTHTETLCVVEGSGEMTMDGKSLEMKPGTVVVIPMNTVHAATFSGSGDWIAYQIFTPALKEPDRVSVP